MLNPFQVGIDIEDISRFVKKPYPRHRPFYEKIFSADEIAYCLGKKNPYPHFAVRFCAKEAFIKAFRKSLLISPKIEVVIEGNTPFVRYNGKRYTASLSHENEKAIAIVIV